MAVPGLQVTQATEGQHGQLNDTGRSFRTLSSQTEHPDPTGVLGKHPGQ